MEDSVALGISDALFVTIPRGRYNDLDAQIQLRDELSAPLLEGEVVGRIVISLGDERVATRDLATLGPVAEAGFFRPPLGQSDFMVQFLL